MCEPMSAPIERRNAAHGASRGTEVEEDPALEGRQNVGKLDGSHHPDKHGSEKIDPPLHFSAVICYKQFTESSVWLAGLFLQLSSLPGI